MSTVVDNQISEAESKLTLLLREVKTDKPVIAQRVELWIARLCGGKKLSVFLHDDAVPAKNRVMVASSLVDILLQKQYDRLPDLAEAPPPEPRTTPQTPAPASPPQPAPHPASDESEREMPAPDELRAMIRKEVRLEFADLLERIAKVLRE